MSNDHTQETIVVGVIGPGIIVEKMIEALKFFPTFEPVIRIYQHDDDAPALAQELLGSVEVLVFTGYIPYRKASEQLNFSIPAHYIPLTGTGLYGSLFRLKKLYGLSSLSIDTLFPSTIEQILQDLQEPHCQLYCFGGSSLASHEALVQFHQQKFEQGISSAVLTGVSSVSETLTDLNIPNEWVRPTIQDMIVTLQRALLSTTTRRNKESQVVVGLIHIDNFDQLVKKSSGHLKDSINWMDMQQIFTNYMKCLEGYVSRDEEKKFSFVTTRGVFERETYGYKRFSLLEEVKEALGISISVGIGFGLSANLAGSHARMALSQATDFGGDACFIVREDRSVIGPVEMKEPMVYPLSTTDPKLLQQAEKAGMTATYMSKLMAQINRFGKKNYTAQELADVLGVTLRSTHRILLQWNDAGLVDIVGEEKKSVRGRPRQVYRLSFIDEQAQ